ncbi:MAG TPA: hypothetical protein VIL84_06845 [Devosiaceae bacterium]
MQMADVVIHIDETVDHDRRTAIADIVRDHKGVMGVAHHDEKPHLMIVEYDPGVISAHVLLDAVKAEGVHAELVGM